MFLGAGLIAELGLLLVVQNITGSLFNSHLFDFTEGWLYVLGVGVAGGILATHSRCGAAEGSTRGATSHRPQAAQKPAAA
jgi:hypothetical protein